MTMVVIGYVCSFSLHLEIHGEIYSCGQANYRWWFFSFAELLGWNHDERCIHLYVAFNATERGYQTSAFALL